MTDRGRLELAFASMQTLRDAKKVNSVTDFPLLPQASSMSQDSTVSSPTFL